MQQLNVVCAVLKDLSAKFLHTVKQNKHKKTAPGFLLMPLDA